MGRRTALVVTLSLALALPERASADTQLWYSAKVADAKIATGKNTTLQTVSKLTCAAHATHTTWCDLFCYQEGQCLLSDVKASGRQDDSSYGPVVPCWTKHACVVDDVGYVHSATFTYNCYPMKCWHHIAIPSIPSAPSTCTPPFMDSRLGCFYQHTVPMSWCDARIFCSNIGGDLAVPLDYHGFEEWVRDTGSGADKWIGAKALTWLDGTAVTSDLWTVYDPNGAPDDCIRMVFMTSLFQLGDSECNTMLEFVCEVKF